MHDNDSTAQYEIRIRGVLSDRMLGAFPEMERRLLDHETALTGALPDQSALHGVLHRIEALGLELLLVRRVGRRRHASPRAEATPAASPGD